MERIEGILTNIVEEKQLKLTLRGSIIYAKTAFSDHGLMPALTKRADELSTLCLGYGIGVDYMESNNTILGMKVNFDDVTPLIIRVFFLVDVLMEIISNNNNKNEVSLDELLYD